MKILRYRLRFTTPAFLGNAEQAGQWRTPPFKALLRQWWRVVWAADHGFDENISRMREAEGRLFGVAAGKSGGSVNRKSLIRLRLDTWRTGRDSHQTWGRKDTLPSEKVWHPEVGSNGLRVGSLLYLGFGPLEYKQGATKLKNQLAIKVGEAAKLSIASPASDASNIRTALALVNAYGTVGGRSRNGWGSFSLTPVGPTPALTTNLRRFSRPWKDALKLDWPHAIGDEQGWPLIWQTAPYNDWESVMRALAKLKIGLRTQKFPLRLNAAFGDRLSRRKIVHGHPQGRHWLSYPITNHDVRAWRNNRLPNSLRFKVRADSADSRKLRGVVFHVPCAPPEQFLPKPGRRQISQRDLVQSEIVPVWRKVHRFLDHSTPVKLTRISA